MTERLGSSIEVTGVKATIRALEVFAPEIRERLNKNIREALATTNIRAKGHFPQGAWVVRINKKKLLGTIMAKPGNRVDNKWGDSDPGVKAAIFEFAGSRTSGATPQSKGLIASLNRRYGQPGRFLWAAWDETGKDVLDRIRTAMLAAERDLQSKLDSTGETF